MKVRYFDFPKFDIWFQDMDKGYKGKLGEYNCHIRTFSWGENERQVVFAVSVRENPLNIYSETVFSRSFRWQWNDLENRDEASLKEWYEKSIQEFKDFWCEYILKNYLDGGFVSTVSLSEHEFDCEGEYCGNLSCGANHNGGCFAPIEEYADCCERK